MPPEDEGELVAAARGGDERALSALLERASPRVLALVRARLGRPLRARLESGDVLQAALLRACERLDQFRGADERAFQAWLLRIAENEIRDQVDHHQRGRRHMALDEPLPSEGQLVAETRSLVSRVALDEQTLALHAALDDLPADQKEVVVQRAMLGLTFPEIGVRLGRSADACRMLFTRAMTALTVKMNSRA